jgi:hypothetical protein
MAGVSFSVEAVVVALLRGLALGGSAALMGEIGDSSAIVVVSFKQP